MGASDGNTSELLALTSADNGQTMGLLNTISYDEEIINVKIVPINGAGTNFNLLGLQQKLNTIYQPAVASWQVQVLASVTLPDTWNGTVEGLADTETGMLSNYTAEMNDLIKAYLQGHDRDKDAYYIFLVDKAETPGKKGYMPRKKQWGFAFADVHGTSDDALAKTIAHELGHGVFRLEHTFSEKGLPQSQTTNLMDYTDDGTDLYKYQWDYVHDPVNVVTLFDGDEEASLYDCPRWFGTDEECESVGTILDAIKKAVQIGDMINMNAPKGLSKEVVGENIYLDGVKFNRIKVVNLLGSDKIEIMKPSKYYEYKETFLTVEGEIDIQEGFVFRSGENSLSPLGMIVAPPAIFKIIVYDDIELLNEKKEILRNYLFGNIHPIKLTTEDLSEDQKVLPTEIVIRYERMGRNEYRTWGKFKVVGTDYEGYVLERPKGANPTTLEKYKRHPAGTYEIGYSEDAGGNRVEFYYVTMYINEHPAYKLHGGNRADDSDGCLLINSNSPQFDSYPRANKFVDPNLPPNNRVKRTDKVSVANTWYSHDDPNNPAFKLRKKIEEIESAIKDKYKIENVVKKIIIDESKEVIDP
jgi:hypothetical protein